MVIASCILGEYCGYIRIKESKMETTTGCWGYIEVISGEYSGYTG